MENNWLTKNVKYCIILEVYREYYIKNDNMQTIYVKYINENRNILNVTILNVKMEVKYEQKNR